MLKRLRSFIWIGAVLVIAASAFRLFSARAAETAASPQQTQSTVETAVVDTGDIDLTVNATGNILAKQSVALAFATSGKVTAINVKAGDHIVKGQTIATVDNQALMDGIASAQLKVVQAQLALKTLTDKPRQVDIDVAQANLKQAQANLSDSKVGPVDQTQVLIAQQNAEIAKNQLWQAQLNRDIQNLNPKVAGNTLTVDQQNKTLSSSQSNVSIAQDQINATKSQGASVGSIDSAEASVVSAQAQLDTLMSGPNADDVKQAQANVASAQAALDQANADSLKTRLVAPIDGIIAQVNMNIGEQAPAAQAVVLVDTSSFYVDLPVSELDIAKVQVNQPVELHFDALPNATLKGNVSYIANVANTSTPVTYTVRVVIDPAGQPLLSSMSTIASIITSNTSNVVRLPNRFIRINRTQNTAFATVKQPDGTFKEVSITLGASNDSYTEIKSGLKAGDVVETPLAAGAQGGAGGARPGGFGGGGGFPLRGLGGG
jgi:RND family efflux transporter MFP subunit